LIISLNSVHKDYSHVSVMSRFETKGNDACFLIFVNKKERKWQIMGKKLDEDAFCFAVDNDE